MDNTIVIIINSAYTLITPVIKAINDFLNSIYPGHAVWLLIPFVLLLSYYLKEKSKGGILSWMLFAFLIYCTFRFLGLGV